MSFKDMDPRYVLYGALSVLDNTIAALQSEQFSDLTMKQHFLLVSIRMYEESPTLGGGDFRADRMYLSKCEANGTAAADKRLSRNQKRR